MRIRGCTRGRLKPAALVLWNFIAVKAVLANFKL
jgi:hypothetical protein